MEHRDGIETICKYVRQVHSAGTMFLSIQYGYMVASWCLPSFAYIILCLRDRRQASLWNFEFVVVAIAFLPLLGDMTMAMIVVQLVECTTIV